MIRFTGFLGQKLKALLASQWELAEEYTAYGFEVPTDVPTPVGSLNHPKHSMGIIYAYMDTPGTTRPR